MRLPATGVESPLGEGHTGDPAAPLALGTLDLHDRAHPDLPVSPKRTAVAPARGVSTHRLLWCRPYAIRKARGYSAQDGEELVQVATLRQALQACERSNNTIRSHRPLEYLSHTQFVTQWQHNRKEKISTNHQRVLGVDNRF